MYLNNPQSQKAPDSALTRQNIKRAEKMLEKCIVRLNIYKDPILTCGEGYPGIWLEHNHDSLFYAQINPEIAKSSHRIFYDFQSPEGMFPAYLCKWPHESAYQIGYGHIQSVYPLAASAYTIARQTADESFLADSYLACVRYDNWMAKYRDTRGTGLVEMFCGFDTGHDNSARIADMDTVCPQGDGSRCANQPHLPILSPDLSAMRYRGQLALADMADALGKTQESADWREKAAQLRQKIYQYCFDPTDEFFYDVAPDGSFRRFPGEHLFRMLVNGVVEPSTFDRIFERYINHPAQFMAPYPFTSMAISSPFYSNLDRNNWGGRTQTHTALEALFWMEQYGKAELLQEFMTMWVNLCNDSDMICTQEVDPFTGEFSDVAHGFSTTLIMYIEFAKRLLR